MANNYACLYTAALLKDTTPPQNTGEFNHLVQINHADARFWQAFLQ